MSLHNRIAIVTGANRGIGKVILQKLIKERAFVIGTATTQNEVKKINKYSNSHCYGMILDITNPEAIQHMVSIVSKKFGTIDILVNNAGIKQDNLLLRMSIQDWINVINTNLNSIFYMTKNVIKVMLQRNKGRIITIGSVIADIGNYGQVNYSASKSGIIGFNKSLAIEVASRGITANVVSPGFIKTSMTNVITNALKKIYLSKIPMKKFGKSEDVANAVLFLASDEASYITGETLHVNGGLYMK